jgi:hypothetical protein
LALCSPPRLDKRLAQRALLVALLGWALGCGGGEEAAAPSASASAREPSLKLPPVVAKRAEADPNPLALSTRKVEIAAGARVFTVPEEMLRGAKMGSAFAFRAVTVKGRDGEDLVVDGRDGPEYRVSPAYVIPLAGVTRPKLESPVIAEWAGVLRHGVVRKYVKDKIMVRFLDTVDSGDRPLAPEQLALQKDGFHPGNYAVVRSAAAEPGSLPYQHVMLVSPVSETGDWLAIGYGGSARVVAEKDMLAVPLTYTPKDGSVVWAEHLGRMREGTVTQVDRPGLITVRFARVGRPVTIGWGSLMPPAK